MKTLSKLFLVFSVFFISTNVFAEPLRFELDQIVDIYSDGIDHCCSGVSESCILHVAQMKLTYPSQNYDAVLKKLEYIIKNDSSQTKRLKALIARNCILEPKNFNWIKSTSHEEMDVFCKSLLKGYVEKISMVNY